MVCRGRFAAVRGAAGAAHRWSGPASGLDLFVGRLGRAHLAAPERREVKGDRPGASRSESDLRLRREPLVVPRCGALVLRDGPAHGPGGENGIAEGSDSRVWNGL